LFTIAAIVFLPGQWTDFFLLVGTGAVTLTGLVFVAMSLNLSEIAIDATHRNRAINPLLHGHPAWLLVIGAFKPKTA
jgi:hypothetical protein